MNLYPNKKKLPMSAPKMCSDTFYVSVVDALGKYKKMFLYLPIIGRLYIFNICLDSWIFQLRMKCFIVQYQYFWFLLTTLVNKCFSR